MMHYHPDLAIQVFKKKLLKKNRGFEIKSKKSTSQAR